MVALLRAGQVPLRVAVPFGVVPGTLMLVQLRLRHPKV